MPKDRLSAELRSAERDIDTHYLTNPFACQPFAWAAWYFLTFCEDLIFGDIIQGGTAQSESAALADNVMVHAKWPLKWLITTCPPGGRPPRRCDHGSYLGAKALSTLAMKYLNVEAAFTYASCGLITLVLDGTTIRVSSPRPDLRYEAYDRLVTNQIDPTVVELADKSFSQRVDASVRLRGDSFKYDLNPKIVRDGLAALGPAITTSFALPSNWQFPRFTLDQLRQVARVLWVLSFIHFRARLAAAELGCQTLGLSDAVLLFEPIELVNRVSRYSSLSEPVTSEILHVLTYGSSGQTNPDPALQPLIPLSERITAIAPNLILNSAVERNLSVLLNRLPEERCVYAALSQSKERVARERLNVALSDKGFRFWHGNISEWGAASQIDYAIVSDDERQCLLLELKSFIGPAEPREIIERSEEIHKGVKQVYKRMEMAKARSTPLYAALRVDDSYKFGWAVASESAIGAASVQDASIPVVNLKHLISKLQRDSSLVTCCAWLAERAYLPTEGIDFRVVPIVDKIGKWSLEWYAIKCLVDDYVER